MEKIVAVVGPTRSGKTELGRILAKKFNGIIISADSRQVYRGLDIGTGKEGVFGRWQGEPARFLGSSGNRLLRFARNDRLNIAGNDKLNTPQLLIDVAKPGERFTLTDWLREARRLITKVIETGRLPIIVGGTGLYVTALLENWQPGGEAPKLRQELAQKPLRKLQEMAGNLNLNDSDFANSRRLIRALEKEASHRVSSRGKPEYESLIIQLEIPNEELFRRADERYERIFSRLLEEVSSLVKNRSLLKWLAEIGLDYKFAVLAFRHDLSAAEAIQGFKRAVHAYIRRQKTWWRGHGRMPVCAVSDSEEALKITATFLAGEENQRLKIKMQIKN